MPRVVVRKGYRSLPGRRRELLAALQRKDALAAEAGWPRGRYLSVETRAPGEPNLEVEFAFESYAELERLERRLRERLARAPREVGSGEQEFLLEPSATRYLLLLDEGASAAGAQARRAVAAPVPAEPPARPVPQPAPPAVGAAARQAAPPAPHAPELRQPAPPARSAAPPAPATPGISQPGPAARTPAATPPAAAAGPRQPAPLPPQPLPAPARQVAEARRPTVSAPPGTAAGAGQSASPAPPHALSGAAGPSPATGAGRSAESGRGSRPVQAVRPPAAGPPGEVLEDEDGGPPEEAFEDEDSGPLDEAFEEVEEFSTPPAPEFAGLTPGEVQTKQLASARAALAAAERAVKLAPVRQTAPPPDRRRGGEPPDAEERPAG